MLKEIIKSFTRKFGLSINSLDTIRYLESKDRLPPPNIDGITFALSILFSTGRAEGLNFLQVGACDGKSGDPIFEFAKLGVMNSVFLEPVPQSFKKLQDTYKGVANARFLNCALGVEDGTSKFYTIEGLDACQIASFEKSFVEKWAPDFKQNAVIQEIYVDVVSYKSLSLKLAADQFHIVQIDVEGRDDEIVKSILNSGEKLPLIINFESVHINKSKAQHLFNELNINYYFFHDKWNTIAIKKDFIKTI
jgi:FkbM family methyltransferase